MGHHYNKIIYCAEQIVVLKWCLSVVKRIVIPINLIYSDIIPRKRYITEGGGGKNLRQGEPQSRPQSRSETGSEGEKPN